VLRISFERLFTSGSVVRAVENWYAIAAVITELICYLRQAGSIVLFDFLFGRKHRVSVAYLDYSSLLYYGLKKTSISRCLFLSLAGGII
jgi:hypothetical protein